MCLFCNQTTVDVDTYIRNEGEYLYDDTLPYTEIEGNSTEVIRFAPIIQIWCADITKIPSFTSTIPFSVEIIECDSLVEIDEIATIPKVYITECINLQRIGRVSNVDWLWIMDCPKLLSAPTLRIDNIDDCPNLMDFVGGPFRIVKEDGSLYNHNGFYRNSEIDYKTVINGLKKLQKNNRLRRFLRLCKTRSFNQYFWNPKNMGGQWHMNRMLKEWTATY